jgi:hypothetical protein
LIICARSACYVLSFHRGEIMNAELNFVYVVREKIVLERGNHGLKWLDRIEIHVGSIVRIPKEAKWGSPGDEKRPDKAQMLINGLSFRFGSDFQGKYVQHFIGPYDMSLVQDGKLWIAQGTVGQTAEDWKLKLQLVDGNVRIPFSYNWGKDTQKFGQAIIGQECIEIDYGIGYRIAPRIDVSAF